MAQVMRIAISDVKHHLKQMPKSRRVSHRRERRKLETKDVIAAAGSKWSDLAVGVQRVEGSIDSVVSSGCNAKGVVGAASCQSDLGEKELYEKGTIDNAIVEVGAQRYQSETDAQLA